MAQVSSAVPAEIAERQHDAARGVEVTEDHTAEAQADLAHDVVHGTPRFGHSLIDVLDEQSDSETLAVLFIKLRCARTPEDKSEAVSDLNDTLMRWAENYFVGLPCTEELAGRIARGDA